jgi:hypothetical protein
MTPYRSCAPPSTIWSARDSCCNGAFQRPVFWWRHLDRGADGDVAEAEAAIERLAAARTDDGLAIREVTLLRLRALPARAHGDDAAYRDYRDRYRAMATSLGLDGHTAWAKAMPCRRSLCAPIDSRLDHHAVADDHRDVAIPHPEIVRKRSPGRRQCPFCRADAL